MMGGTEKDCWKKSREKGGGLRVRRDKRGKEREGRDEWRERRAEKKY